MMLGPLRRRLEVAQVEAMEALVAMPESTHGSFLWDQCHDAIELLHNLDETFYAVGRALTQASDASDGFEEWPSDDLCALAAAVKRLRWALLKLRDAHNGLAVAERREMAKGWA
jgi:hypothetical protein